MSEVRFMAARLGTPIFNELIFVDDGLVCTVVLNRPEAANALSLRLLAELHVVLDRVGASVDCAVLVITGAGGNFCGGDDLAGVTAEGFTDAPATVESFGTCRDDLVDKLEELDKFTVSAVDGLCVGGGLEIAMACDFVISTERALCRIPALDEGWLSNSVAGKTSMAGLLDRRIATETLLRGALHSEVGLFNKVVDDMSLAVETVQLVERLLATSQDRVQAKLTTNSAIE